MRYDEFRQGAISSKIDLTLPVDSTRVGGSGFKVFGNTAQGGDTASITLAASRSKNTSPLLGMRLLITSGLGAGQYGYIWDYDPVTKVAQIYRDSN